MMPVIVRTFSNDILQAPACQRNVTLSPDDGERYRCGECEVQRVPNVASAGVADSAGNTLKHAEAADVKSPVHATPFRRTLNSCSIRTSCARCLIRSIIRIVQAARLSAAQALLHSSSQVTAYRQDALSTIAAGRRLDSLALADSPTGCSNQDASSGNHRRTVAIQRVQDSLRRARAGLALACRT